MKALSSVPSPEFPHLTLYSSEKEGVIPHQMNSNDDEKGVYDFYEYECTVAEIKYETLYQGEEYFQVFYFHFSKVVART
jgi:hypothetical protein